MKAEGFAITLEDAQMLERRIFSAEEVFGFFSVPVAEIAQLPAASEE